MKPLGAAAKAKMAARRTCPKCGKVRKQVVRGKECTVCRAKAYEEQRRREARTCWGCREVFERRLPAAHHRCGECRSKQLAELREKAAAWVEEVTVCAGDGCMVKLVTKTEARAFQKSQGKGRSWWYRAEHWARRCPSCTEAEERRQAEQRAEYERREQERREAERQEAEERQRWAAAALVDPDVVVLDTETTGLHAEARIIEIAVLSSRGEVLLDTLLDPGEPVPGDAADIHGITSDLVAGAPTFSSIAVRLTELLDHKRVLIYNKWFDVARLGHELTLHYLDRAARDAAEETARTGTAPDDVREQALALAGKQAAAWLDAMTFEDVMIPYSDWVGDYSEYHGSNRWQPLDGGHRAAEDCRAVLSCLRAMGRAHADDYAAAAIGADAMSEGTD
ncbi:3'-5' exonuclease [Streptomyces sp. 4503]|uniref:3'-5' exonuclease n=2 Tax=Streptomyces niphimycinicus TaxID=2842201 RepID=A0ABS6CFC2_9ACTN|nr:3'-5' exonuclease [Streptomyces niphimycinicus]